jgi:hypothetical protein
VLPFRLYFIVVYCVGKFKLCMYLAITYFVMNPGLLIYVICCDTKIFFVRSAISGVLVLDRNRLYVVAKLVFRASENQR